MTKNTFKTLSLYNQKRAKAMFLNAKEDDGYIYSLGIDGTVLSRTTGTLEYNTNVNLQIQVIMKEVYGKTMYYPHCSMSHFFCDLLKQKVLTKNNLDDINKAGFKVAIKANSEEF